MKSIWRIIRFTRELWPYYAGVSVFTILLAAMSQLVPLFTKGAIDQISKLLAGGHANVKLVAIFAILIFITDVGQTLFSNFGGYLGDILSAKINKSMSQRYFEHLLELPQKYFDTELSGKIINRMNRGISQISSYIQTISNNFLQFIFSTVFSLAIVAYYSWQVALMLGVLYPVFIWLTSRTSKAWQGYQHRINDHLDVATGRFGEVISQIKVVKSYRRQHGELEVFDRHYNKVVDITRPQSMLWHRQDVVRRVILNIIFFAIYIYIFVETAHGVYTLGTMVLLIQYAMLIRIPIFSISFIVDQTQRAIANTKDYFDVMDERPDIVDHDGAQPLVFKKGRITFNGVDFGYDHSKPVLNELTFELQPNSKLALVGESGEGKTTITSLLLRLYEVQKGSILIDGQDINDVTQASLHEAIGVVFQDPALFSGTIRENIAYGNPKAKQKAIEAAAEAANAHEFITGFEKGYETEIGERGLKLSGGQKQRIAIARALLKDAPILILDEATSSLDTKSERKVQEALEHLMQGRTTLIIAHRLSTIQSVDTIVTLRNGKVDEIGSPDKLAHSGGIYAELLNLQQRHTEETGKKLKAYGIEED
ncbi:MAG: ABC transporter ATP-binding protein [Candidatus Saccharimonadales bacterium]